MSQNTPLIRPELAADAGTVDHITSVIFGPGMKARAAYALREGIAHEIDLSFVAETDEEIIGTVRLTRIVIGDQTALMLGPLGVLPKCKNQGVGKLLMEHAVAAARQKVEQGGDDVIMLVGDLDYYRPFGFKRVPVGSISLPRPVDMSRILVCDLVEAASANLSGSARRYSV